MSNKLVEKVILLSNIKKEFIAKMSTRNSTFLYVSETLILQEVLRETKGLAPTMDFILETKDSLARYSADMEANESFNDVIRYLSGQGNNRLLNTYELERPELFVYDLYLEFEYMLSHNIYVSGSEHFDSDETLRKFSDFRSMKHISDDIFNEFIEIKHSSLLK